MVTVIPIVIGALRLIPKEQIQGLKDLDISGQKETIQSTALLRSARILRRVLKTCYYTNSSEKPSTNAGVRNSQKIR